MSRAAKPMYTMAALLLAGSAVAWAQQAPVPPPPGIDDPGVQPAVSVPANTPVHVVPAPASTVLPPDATPDVNIRHEGDDTVEEYRRNGQLYMIRVVPKSGVPQVYMDTDGDGRLERGPESGPVAPVYYKIYEWGKPPKPVGDEEP